MIAARRSVSGAAACAVCLLLVIPASADAQSCKGDRKLDEPMPFSVTIESAGRVHVSASGGKDKSGWVIPFGSGAWRLYDYAGRKLDQFSRASLGFASNDMMKETTIEGLVAGGTYTIEFASQDYCNNKGTVRRTITMPAVQPEAQAPAVSTPTIVRTGFLTYDQKIHFSATDDTGVARVAVFINGTLVSESRYTDNAGFRWWCDEYTLDSVTSTLEGPNTYFSYPSAYQGQACLVEIVVEDMLGNITTSQAELWL
jgi:hypothetical protein